MGIGSTKKKLLTNEEVDKFSLSNRSLEKLFLNLRSYDGYITFNSFNYLFKKVDREIVDILFRLFSTDKDKIYYEDLKYIYALFTCNKFQVKLNFITELIFFDKTTKNTNAYFERVVCLFDKHEGLKSKLISIEFMNRLFDKNKNISKENFVKNLAKFNETFFNNFEFLDLKKTICNCHFAEARRSSYTQNDLSDTMYGRMEVEFKKMEKNNDNLFTISMLERILTELGVKPELILIIQLYIKRQIQKNFFDYKFFKQFLITFIVDNSQKIKLYYNILAYPNKFIEKKTLLKLFEKKKEAADAVSILEKNLPNNIEINIFEEIFNEFSIFNDIFSTLDRINYIPYLYFKVQPEGKLIQKKCIEILTKGEKDLKKLIEKLIITEGEFYIVDYEFWLSWCIYVSWNDEESMAMDSTPYESRGPRINNYKIQGSFNRLKPEKKYLEDYVILPYNIYNLFTRWYMSSGEEIKIKKSINNIKNEYSPVSVEIDNKFFELEINPFVVKFFTFEEIYPKLSEISNSGIKSILKMLSESSSNYSRIKTYSRLTKFNQVKKDLSELINQSNINLWCYTNSNSELFKISEFEMSLEDESHRLDDFFLVIVDSLKNGKWFLDAINNEENIKQPKAEQLPLNPLNLIGIQNIGNTCYMNSVLQCLLNITELKEVFMGKRFNYLINIKNKHGNKGKIISEFLKLFEEKFDKTNSGAIKPVKFKEKVGEYNPQFKNFQQQDAQEFFNLLIDILHEEINLKDEKEYIPNPENFDYTDSELSSEYWANNLRRNVSFIHSLFLGQLKSNLICVDCGTNKISYETFTNLSLPIPQKKTIKFEIVLFRLPYTFKVYLNKNNPDDKSLRTSLLNMKSDANIDGDKLYNSRLSTTIPLKILIEIDRKLKLKNVISAIKEISEIELEQDAKFTNFIFMTNNEGAFLDTDLIIDECIQANQLLYVYEVLSTKGIDKIQIEQESPLRVRKDSLTLYQSKRHMSEILTNDVNINEEISYSNAYANITDVLPINSHILTNFNYPGIVENHLNFNLPNKSEYLINITHRYPVESRDAYFIRKDTFANLGLHFSILLVNNHQNFSARYLYDFIFEKYEYLFNNPTKMKNSNWWSNSSDYSEESIKEISSFCNNNSCSPFVIKILNKENNSCPTCPWFNFCNGCVLNPNDQAYLLIQPSQVIVVEWCYNTVKSQINENNLKLILNHESLKQKEETSTMKTLEECFGLFLEKEYLEEESPSIFCYKCRELKNFYKQYELDRLPPFLTLSVKRFKYAKLYKKKIDSLIEFPIDNFNLKNKNYELYAVINHSGVLSAGHYTATVKTDSRWVKCDDKKCYEVSEKSLVTQEAYMLIYRLKGEITNEYFLMMSRIIRGLYVEEKETGVFFVGEPVRTKYGRGFVEEIIERENVRMVKVKFRFGCGVMKYI